MAGLAVLALLVPAGSAGAETTFEFCRNVAEDYTCIGPAREFATVEPRIWVIVRPSDMGPYEGRLDWVQPDGSIYATARQRTPEQRATYRWRLSIPVRGQQAESLPGAWTVRFFVNNQPAGSGGFVLKQVGESRISIPSLGLVSVVAIGTAHDFDNQSGTAINPGTEFHLGVTGDTIRAYVKLAIPPVDAASAPKTVPGLVRWTAPSGEVLESSTRWNLKAGYAMVWWGPRMPSYEGKVQKPIGLWQVEFLVEGVPAAKTTFTLTP